MSKFSRQLYLLLLITVLAIAAIAVMVSFSDDADTTSSKKNTKKMIQAATSGNSEQFTDALTNMVNNAVNTAPSNQSPGGGGGSNTFTDSRDGKTYKIVVIGGRNGQIWMAENLNYQKGKSWCYENNSSNCDKYGRLYDWNTAKAACPSGWHLPSRQEWKDLVSMAGGDVAGKTLKAKFGWDYGGNGKDNYGFSALPGGYYSINNGQFFSVGNEGYWWTATGYGDGDAYIRNMYSSSEDDPEGDHVSESDFGMGFGYSVRCIEDN
jgi:uncharacterized protein (TIGR02145 family)